MPAKQTTPWQLRVVWYITIVGGLAALGLINLPRLNDIQSASAATAVHTELAEKVEACCSGNAEVIDILKQIRRELRDGREED